MRDRARSLAQTRDSGSLPGDQLKILEFRLAKESYAIESQYVQEVHPLKDLTPLPCTPPFVVGVVNVRGRIVPVFDLKKLLDLPQKGLIDLHQIILVQGEDFVVGLLADVIGSVRVIANNTLQSSLATLTGIRSDFLKGVTADRLVVLNLPRILSDPRLVVQDEVEV